MTILDAVKNKLSQDVPGEFDIEINRIDAEIERLQRQDIARAREGGQPINGAVIAQMQNDRQTFMEAKRSRAEQAEKLAAWKTSGEYKQMVTEYDRLRKSVTAEALAITAEMFKLAERNELVMQDVIKCDKLRRKLEGDTLGVSITDAKLFINYRMAIMALREFKARYWPVG